MRAHSKKQNHHQVTTDVYGNDLQTGDLIFFDGNSRISKMIKFFTDSPVSHVGMIYRCPITNQVYVWESGDISSKSLPIITRKFAPINGAHLIPLEGKLRQDNNVIYLRRLQRMDVQPISKQIRGESRSLNHSKAKNDHPLIARTDQKSIHLPRIESSLVQFEKKKKKKKSKRTNHDSSNIIPIYQEITSYYKQDPPLDRERRRWLDTFIERNLGKCYTANLVSLWLQRSSGGPALIDLSFLDTLMGEDEKEGYNLQNDMHEEWMCSQLCVVTCFQLGIIDLPETHSTSITPGDLFDDIVTLYPFHYDPPEIYYRRGG